MPEIPFEAFEVFFYLGVFAYPRKNPLVAISEFLSFGSYNPSLTRQGQITLRQMLDNYYTSQNLETELTKLEVDGSLPAWLCGKLVRNGPALFEAGDTKLRHWFDGYGMLH